MILTVWTIKFCSQYLGREYLQGAAAHLETTHHMFLVGVVMRLILFKDRRIKENECLSKESFNFWECLSIFFLTLLSHEIIQ